MIFTPNLPGWERALRLALGFAMAVAGYFAFDALLYQLIAIGSGVGLAATALVGFCPACAMVGRKLPPRPHG